MNTAASAPSLNQGMLAPPERITALPNASCKEVPEDFAGAFPSVDFQTSGRQLTLWAGVLPHLLPLQKLTI